MGDCPNKECQTNLQKILHGIRTTLFGEDGRGGIVSAEAGHSVEHERLKICMGKMITRKALITTTIGLLAILSTLAGGFGVYALDSVKHDRIAIAEKVEENEDSIDKIDTELQLIKQTVEDNSKSLGEIQKKMDEVYISPKSLKKLIKDAVKEGIEP